MASTETDVLILDDGFSKAFDRVNHSLLFHKFQRYGVQGTTNAWIFSFQASKLSAKWNGNTLGTLKTAFPTTDSKPFW